MFTYLACERPVAVSNLPGLQNFKDTDAVRFAGPDCPEDFAKVISELLLMPEAKRRDLGGQGRKFVLERYTWDMAAKKTARHIERWCGLKNDM